MFLSQVRCGTAGDPDTVAPGSRSCATPDWAPMRAPSPMERCPMIPTCPATTTPMPSLLDPETPDCATRRESGPTSTLWATMTRSSILTPRPMRVTPRAARSTQLLAPISTSSSTTTIPTCGNLKWRGPWPSPSGSKANPNPSAPITTPGCRMTRFPRRQRSRITTLE